MSEKSDNQVSSRLFSRQRTKVFLYCLVLIVSNPSNRSEVFSKDMDMYWMFSVMMEEKLECRNLVRTLGTLVDYKRHVASYRYTASTRIDCLTLTFETCEAIQINREVPGISLEKSFD